MRPSSPESGGVFTGTSSVDDKGSGDVVGDVEAFKAERESSLAVHTV